MPSQPDYYAVLGVQQDASTDDIKRAYRRLIKSVHPDRLEAERTRATSAAERAAADRRIAAAQQKAQLINQAYTVLSNPRERRQYDARRNGYPPPGTATGYQRPYTRYADSDRYRYDDTVRQRTQPPPGQRAYGYGEQRPPPPGARTGPSEEPQVNPQEFTQRVMFSLFVLMLLLFMCEATLNGLGLGMQPADTGTTSRVVPTDPMTDPSARATAEALGIPLEELQESAIIREGRAAYQVGDFRAAISAFSEGLDRQQTPTLFYWRGLAYRLAADRVENNPELRDDRLRLAVRDFSSALDLNPGHTYAFMQRGLIFYDLWQLYGDTLYRINALEDLRQYAEREIGEIPQDVWQAIDDLVRATPYT
ncbi:MAG: DnaJ domain-containing protein [Chloroflexota bacterium]